MLQSVYNGESVVISAFKGVKTIIMMLAGDKDKALRLRQQDPLKRINSAVAQIVEIGSLSHSARNIITPRVYTLLERVAVKCVSRTCSSTL